MNSATDWTTRFTHTVAAELGVSVTQILSAIDLLNDGRTIPFIARYRKEITGNLDERQLRSIEDRLLAARQLEDRRTAVLSALHDKPIPAEVLAAIRSAVDRTTLEQLYEPWRSRRKTRADAARERGLQPLADLLLRQSVKGLREVILSPFVDPSREVPDDNAALQGACDIVAEEWSRDIDLRAWMMERSLRGRIASRVKRGRSDDHSPYRDYFDRSEAVSRIAGHRVLAMLRGRTEGVLNVSLQLDDDWILPRLERRLIHRPQFVFASALCDTVDDCYKRLLLPAAESFVLQQLRERADSEAIAVFESNLREILMAAPAGAPHPTIGIDPGFRSGCKLAVVDHTGRYLDHTTIYPTPPKSDITAAAKSLGQLIDRYDVELIAIGNGTASRETHAFVLDSIRESHPEVICAVVSEAGASIYSASETAIAEFPDLDITIRGAISIAHRLQDPLAELVKLDPATVGVGQYQHDVDQRRLRHALEREVESCVSRVGVDVNTASVPLLSRVAGIGPKLAAGIVEFRSIRGSFHSREELRAVPKLGPVAFEQAAGFLRIASGSNVLDRSAVHPESYSVVNDIAARLGCSVESLLADTSLLDSVEPEDFVTEQTGLPTVMDIFDELRRPGLDPRADFRTVEFRDDIRTPADLRTGMELDGVVTNVTAFGAFVDVGVHQDGLLHISEMADHFVSSPANEVKPGDIIRVRVLAVDADRNRISLSRKSRQ